MLISDWSSDVCSSDLHDLHTHHHWALIRGTGKRPMVPPHDPRHPANTTSAGAARAAPTQVPTPTGPAPAAPSEAPTTSLPPSPATPPARAGPVAPPGRDRQRTRLNSHH